jgi:hypothetical protein
MSKIEGGCLCGNIRYEIDNASAMGHCHCSRCQRCGGAAHATVFATDRDNFRLVAGEDSLGTYCEEGFGDRGFCKNCGSSLYGEGGGAVYVEAGTASGDPGLRPSFHIFVADKVSWHEILDDLPQHQGWPS